MLGALIPVLCVNQVEIRMHDYIQEVQEAERLIASAQYKKAFEVLPDASDVREDLRDRVRDLRALLALRAKNLPGMVEEEGWVVRHFKDRVKANPKDVRFKAWLAEAQLAEGESTQALVLVNELRERDLMPDAFAYVTLAKLSIGPARAKALETCRKRAKAKAICNVPKIT